MNCKITGCENLLKQQGLCSKHAMRLYKHGSPHIKLSRWESHGMRHTPEYETWKNMKARCYRVASSKYARYGGRGIKVCDRWLHSFKNFYEDMGLRPSSKHSLDRKNVNGDYEPSNCRWATPLVQAWNRKVQQNNTSGYRGVSHQRPERWRVIIRYDKNHIHVGSFLTKEEAALVYDQFALQLFGDEAYTNLL